MEISKAIRDQIKACRANAEIARIQAATHWRAKDRHEASARHAEAIAAQADAEADALEKHGRYPTLEEVRTLVSKAPGEETSEQEIPF